MRILHVWDQAGVSCLLAMYQRMLGHVVDIIMREEFSAGILEHYGFVGRMFFMSEEIDRSTSVRRTYYKLPEKLQSMIRSMKRQLRSIRFLLKVRSESKNYDIIHIHSCWKAIFFIPFKPKILHWHGDDCRSKPSLKPWWKRLIVKLFIRLYAIQHQMYISTPDLHADVPDAVWLPNPVDTIMFKRRTDPMPKTVFYMFNWYEDGCHAEQIASERGLKLFTVNRRDASDWIPYGDMPSKLSMYEYFIDRKNIPSLSKTALEALSIGMIVIQGWNKKIVKRLEPQHEPLACARRCLNIYERILA